MSLWFVLIELLMDTLEINFVSDRFFSRLAKYLLFFSPNLTMFAFDRIIKRFNLVSVMVSSVLLFFIKLIFQ